ncbi:MAG: hypothetical protein FWD91_08210 [Treponema sp.]|nr:hypothetical protein [Treponema sp.]
MFQDKTTEAQMDDLKGHVGELEMLKGTITNLIQEINASLGDREKMLVAHEKTKKYAGL